MGRLRLSEASHDLTRMSNSPEKNGRFKKNNFEKMAGKFLVFF
jgi:hypothetical protein